MLFQSTPARGGRLATKFRIGCCADVSIHARTWRATSGRWRCCRRPTRFNPRPHVAGDNARWAQWAEGQRFNPRPHVAGDLIWIHDQAEEYDVSIHARTWRATSRRCRNSCCWQRFNPRPHVAGDRKTPESGHWRCCFNPRPHVAGDGRLLLPEHVAAGVSIHARTWRATQKLTQPTRHRSVSIHARTWRATRRANPTRHSASCFNPRPHVAGDTRHNVLLALADRFNPRPHVAGDLGTLLTWMQDHKFQSTPARGGRHSGLGERYYWLCVSIHARTWRAT